MFRQLAEQLSPQFAVQFQARIVGTRQHSQQGDGVVCKQVRPERELGGGVVIHFYLIRQIEWGEPICGRQGSPVKGK